MKLLEKVPSAPLMAGDCGPRLSKLMDTLPVGNKDPVAILPDKVVEGVPYVMEAELRLENAGVTLLITPAELVMKV